VDAGDRSFDRESHAGAIFSRVAERERGNLSEQTKAGVARARNEGKYIGRPFQKINWRKVDEYREIGLLWAAISRVMEWISPTTR